MNISLKATVAAAAAVTILASAAPASASSLFRTVYCADGTFVKATYDENNEQACQAYGGWMRGVPGTGKKKDERILHNEIAHDPNGADASPSPR